MLAKIKAAFARWLERLSKENKRQFGEGPLDCCKTGREKANF
jgi:hypothetical protein